MRNFQVPIAHGQDPRGILVVTHSASWVPNYDGRFRMLLFLDIDGVLRPIDSPMYTFEDDCLRCLEGVLREFPEVEIVISSSWREAFPMREITRRFSPDIAARVIGCPPVTQRREGAFRHREVLAFLKKRGLESTPWVAIDDDPELYPQLKNVILTDRCVGIDERLADQLRTLLIEARTR